VTLCGGLSGLKTKLLRRVGHLFAGKQELLLIRSVIF
jgi:hypothetical protein